MLGEISIARRFNGPPQSANGGYFAGRLAEFVNASAATVRLQVPPPLERPMTVHEAGEGVELRDGDVVVGSARPASLSLAPPFVVTPDEAAAAAARPGPWADPERHPFPTCFGCGPLREAGDALRHICGPVRDGVVACPACTDPALPYDFAGNLEPAVVWAALDCPTAAAVVPEGAGPHVLATFTVTIERPVKVGRPHVVVAWPGEVEGRKKRAGAAILDADGAVCAIADALWIELRQ